jgi:hypothetical protein
MGNTESEGSDGFDGIPGFDAARDGAVPYAFASSGSVSGGRTTGPVATASSSGPVPEDQDREQIAAQNDRLVRDKIQAMGVPRVWQRLPHGVVHVRTLYLRSSLMAPKREYALFVPHCPTLVSAASGTAAAPTQPAARLPIVFHWHGRDESAKEVLAQSRFIRPTPTTTAVVVIPQARGGYEDIEEAKPRHARHWDVRFPFDGDDLDYMQAMLDDLHTLTCPPEEEDLSEWDAETPQRVGLPLDWSRVVSSGFDGGGQWQSVLALRFSHVFAAVANVMGGLSTSQGSLLPPGSQSGPKHAAGKFEPLAPACVPPLAHPERLIPLLIVTSDEDSFLLQCQYAQLCFVERGHVVQWVQLPDETHRWSTTLEFLVTSFFDKQVFQKE